MVGTRSWAQVFGLFAATACGDVSEGSTAWDPEDGSTSGVVPSGDDSSGPQPTTTTATTTTSPPGDASTGDDTTLPEPTPDVPTETCPRVRITLMPGNVLNIRAEPSTAAAEVGELPNNAIVDVIGETTGESIDGTDVWFEIADGDVQGFVTAAYAECTFDDPPELEPPNGFHIPLECDVTTTIAQGNDGGFSHQGAAFYAYDFSVGIGTPLVAMADGIVIHTFAETMPGDPCYDGGGPECFEFGNLVVLLHGDGTTSLYKHLEAVWTADGEFVPQGSPVGLSGSTGYSTGPHAHIMRMEDCGVAQCQSIPLEFLEAGVPETGDTVTSENCPE